MGGFSDDFDAPALDTAVRVALRASAAVDRVGGA
jgi:hypothetical protein